MRSDDSFAAILLVSRLHSKGVKPFKASEYWELCDRLGPLGVILGQSEEELTLNHGLNMKSAGRIARLADRARAMAFELEALDQSGISTLTPFDEHYPDRFVDQLGTKAPALLHAAGDLTLLRHYAGIGIVGSRNVTAEGAEVAKQAAITAAKLGRAVVSGGARGVDQLAMSAAFQAGGKVVGVLADSLVQRLKKPDVRRAIYDEQVVICTPYSPYAGFNVGNAMGRNKLIYALAEVTLVVTCEVGKGGTWSGAIEALRSRSGRVGVWLGAGRGSGNKRLVEEGAIPIRSIEDLEATLNDPESVPVKPMLAIQTSLI